MSCIALLSQMNLGLNQALCLFITANTKRVTEGHF
jgi:hypothetical protein